MASLLPDVSLHLFLLLALTAFVAGMARGFSGFGAALIFVPFASRLLGPQAAAPLLLLTDGFVALPLIWSAWEKARKSEVGLMAVGGLIGIPLGTYALSAGDPSLLRWIISIIVALMLLLLVSGWRYAGKPHGGVTVGVGAMSGVFGGLAQLSGPPVVAYWLGGNHDHREMRASTILYFAFSTLIAFFSYLIGKLLTLTIFKLAVLLAPFFAGGLFLGSRIFHLASPETFRKICLGLIALSLGLSLPVWG
ncbi:MAG: sulfite exporter TauE/SafE family protein [Rhizobiales bacterium]|nr:sulfite exporter TauE/SafE family protein [Hyphomicrobiales bacterium]